MSDNTEQKCKYAVLAFDIERSGAFASNATIGIGASFVTDDLKQVYSLYLPGYFPEDTPFEARCYEEFWSKNLDKLEELKYKHKSNTQQSNLLTEIPNTQQLTFQQRQKQMIVKFQLFRRKCEEYAEANNLQFELCTDNNVYDGGFINQMIMEHTDNFPIPFNTKNKYQPFWETHAQQRGLLMAIDPEFKSAWGLSKRIKELYDLPELQVTHDHNCKHDAYTIACEQQFLLGIRDGKYKLKKESSN